jgi:hypothetical protein
MSKIKETDITASFRSVVDHIKDSIRNNVITAHRKSLIQGLDDRQIVKLCNIIDTTVDEAASKSIGPEARGLISKIK